MNKIKTWLKALGNGERYQSIATLITVVMVIWFVGCQSKTTSFDHPGEMVCREELHVEIDTFLAQAELKLQELDQKDELKSLLLEKSMLVAKGGTINPFGVMTLVAGVMGIGATVDNVRKRKVIKRVSSPV